MERVAVLGTGIMGAMARNLLRAGNDVTVWNRTERKAQPLEDETVIATGGLDAIPVGSLWIQSSTVGVPATGTKKPAEDGQLSVLRPSGAHRACPSRSDAEPGISALIPARARAEGRGLDPRRCGRGRATLVRATSRQFDRAFELRHGEDMSAVDYVSATGSGARS